MGSQEFFLMILPILFLFAIFYLIYRTIDRWVDKSNSIKKEQNALLSEIIKLLEKSNK